MTRLYNNQAFTISHADDYAFEGAGLRPFFEYRRLEISDATAGRFDAHVIRAVPGRASEAKWHTHELEFQMVYVTRGWIVFEYGDQGEHIGPEWCRISYHKNSPKWFRKGKSTFSSVETRELLSYRGSGHRAEHE